MPLRSDMDLLRCDLPTSSWCTCDWLWCRRREPRSASRPCSMNASMQTQNSTSIFLNRAWVYIGPIYKPKHVTPSKVRISQLHLNLLLFSGKHSNQHNTLRRELHGKMFKQGHGRQEIVTVFPSELHLIPVLSFSMAQCAGIFKELKSAAALRAHWYEANNLATMCGRPRNVGTPAWVLFSERPDLATLCVDPEVHAARRTAKIHFETRTLNPTSSHPMKLRGVVKQIYHSATYGLDAQLIKRCARHILVNTSPLKRVVRKITNVAIVLQHVMKGHKYTLYGKWHPFWSGSRC